MSRYPQEIKEKVRALRFEQGLSLGQIQKIIKIPKTTIHLWMKDVPLSAKQKEKIKSEALLLLQSGRMRAQRIQKGKKMAKENLLVSRGKNDVGILNEKELFIAGIALYWAEGFKNRHEHRLGFCNSDPSMVKFYLHWLDKVLQVRGEDLVARLALNISYKEKANEIENYWSEMTGIPLSQFTKTFYQKAQWKKQYQDTQYYGVLRIHVKNSLDYFLTMKGWIEGLRQNLAG